jgi:integrative and conjugative element protein (TIGR02256 family)
VVVSERVTQEIKNYVMPPENSHEAGGILIGSYRGDHIEISACTLPMPKDKRQRYLFHRTDKGHNGAALAAWKASGHTDTYVGEWHTHPEDHPTPSTIDRLTWVRLTMFASDPMIFVIGGRKSFWWGVGKNGITCQVSEMSPFSKIEPSD